MKYNAFIRIAAALLALWYVFATVGFDIHRSADTRDVYILPMFADLSCESIHPEAPCCHHHCCSEGCCHEDHSDADCCSDTFEQLTVLCEQPSAFSAPSPLIVMALVPVQFDATVPAAVGARPAAGPCGICPGPPPDIISSICMLRA